MIYLRRAWGNTGEPVSVEVVQAIRVASDARSQPWTVADLESVAVDRDFGAFVGKYSLSFITITITEEQEGLHMSVPMYGSGILKQLSDTEFEAESGGNQAKLEFVVEPNGSVNTMLLHRGTETNTLARKSE